jgi:hypothetical protein
MGLGQSEGQIEWMDILLQIFNCFIADVLPRPEFEVDQTVIGIVVRIGSELETYAINQGPDTPIDNFHARLLIFLLRIHHLEEREQAHHYLLWQRQPGRVVQRHVATVSDDAIDKLDLARLERERTVPLVERLQIGIRQLGDDLVEDVVLVDCDDA